MCAYMTNHQIGTHVYRYFHDINRSMMSLDIPLTISYNTHSGTVSTIVCMQELAY